MNQDTLFVRTIDELTARSSSYDAYDYVKAAGLLRTLILDGANSLVSLINRNEARRIGLSYTYGTMDSQLRMFKSMGLPSPDQLFILDAFSPKFQLCYTSGKTSGLDSMLKETIMISSGHNLSVKDTVKYIANIDGGVHKGQPTSEKEIAISKIAVSIDDATVYQRSIKGIAQVVIDGTQELYNVCKA